MRFVPLLPSDTVPQPWRPCGAVELAWTGALHPDWVRAALTGLEVHALHLPAMPWTDALGQVALEALQPRLGADFLVIPAGAPGDRLAVARFMAVLEGLLEATQGRGPKLALRPAAGAAPELVRLLREAQGQAVGFCWDAQAAPDLECFSDRLFCAVGDPGVSLAGLQRLGYRWNVALPAQAPEPFLDLAGRLSQAYPPVLFPAELPPVAAQPEGPSPMERP